MSIKTLDIDDLIKERTEDVLNYINSNNLQDKVRENDYDLSSLIHETCDLDFANYKDQDVLSEYFETDDRDRTANDNFIEAYLEYIAVIESKVNEKLSKLISYNDFKILINEWAKTYYNENFECNDMNEYFNDLTSFVKVFTANNQDQSHWISEIDFKENEDLDIDLFDNYMDMLVEEYYAEELTR